MPVSLRLETLGALVEDGDGWALFGRTLLVRVGWVGGLPVELGRYDGHHYVSQRSWALVSQRCAEVARPRGSNGWLTAVEVAKVLKVTDRTVRGWVQEGRLPATVCVRVERVTRILWPEAQAYLTREAEHGRRLRTEAHQSDFGPLDSWARGPHAGA